MRNVVERLLIEKLEFLVNITVFQNNGWLFATNLQAQKERMTRKHIQELATYGLPRSLELMPRINSIPNWHSFLNGHILNSIVLTIVEIGICIGGEPLDFNICAQLKWIMGISSLVSNQTIIWKQSLETTFQMIFKVSSACWLSWESFGSHMIRCSFTSRINALRNTAHHATVGNWKENEEQSGSQSIIEPEPQRERTEGTSGFSEKEPKCFFEMAKDSNGIWATVLLVYSNDLYSQFSMGTAHNWSGTFQRRWKVFHEELKNGIKRRNLVCCRIA